MREQHRGPDSTLLLRHRLSEAHSEMGGTQSSAPLAHAWGQCVRETRGDFVHVWATRVETY